ncbi:hypothetical protein SAMN02745181_3465 [Rubritalea squalenifaciens DSM 18772]|uniref:Uncharacterized protein n=1 Tax=Rubritalea squalenifaciens DSM 18772 TaxID=1123071 RepID=A0A1M6QPG5_9BACT|nr:hypothetical protein [Rubritalea squalenifaciens]SHK22151.1 hypothetical protein SAMN02745181_3465 [Rubritalea squalenifaciens DSM 18772]
MLQLFSIITALAGFIATLTLPLSAEVKKESKPIEHQLTGRITIQGATDIVDGKQLPGEQIVYGADLSCTEYFKYTVTEKSKFVNMVDGVKTSYQSDTITVKLGPINYSTLLLISAPIICQAVPHRTTIQPLANNAKQLNARDVLHMGANRGIVKKTTATHQLTSPEGHKITITVDLLPLKFPANKTLFTKIHSPK